MLIINIGGKYKITGTNEADIYCLSTDTKPTTPQMKNGYRLWEVDTGKEYRYDEENRQWIFWKPYLSTGGGKMSGDIDMSGNEITGLPTVSEDDAAVSYGQVTEMIEAVAGIYRGAFATYAALIAVQWQTTDPTAANYVTNNDWAVVLADETHSDQCWRYGYTIGVGWQAQFKINDTPLSQAQIDAINSGITAALLSAILGNFAEEYDATATYAVGDCCVHAGGLYQCSTAITTAEAWNASHWTAKSVSELFSEAKPSSVSVTLAANAWSNNAQTVTVTGVLADETQQLIQPVPASASSAEYESCGVKATAQATDSLTFSCDTTPTNNLTIYVVITEVAT